MIRAEWTKLRSVRGWVLGALAVALLLALFPLTGLGHGAPGPGAPVPLGPDGAPVVDASYGVRHSFTGDGRLTVPVVSLDARGEWAKAGLLVRSGSRYAAVMVTSGHGARMQRDYVHDVAGPPAARWLRLTRSGDTITGAASVDGRMWHPLGTVRLPGMAARVQVGLFVAAPQVVDGLGTGPDVARAVFGRPVPGGAWSEDLASPGSGSPAGPGDGWTGLQTGEGTATFSGYPPGTSGGYAVSGDGFTVTGSGDLAPATRADLPGGVAAGDLLAGTFPALIVIVVVATLSIVGEFGSGLIRSTLGARPSRARVLAAKATVLAAATFVTALAGVLALPLWTRLVRDRGAYVFPAPPGALLRAEFGTAVALAVVAVLALAAGTVLRRGAVAIPVVLGVVVLPYLVALVPFVPPGVAQWLARLTPAAAFAVQQTLVLHPQVDGLYTPANGYWPLSPAAGLAVLAGFTGLALLLAVVELRRRDA